MIGIFNGTVIYWNDSSIQACNPGIYLPSAPITVVVREVRKIVFFLKDIQIFLNHFRIALERLIFLRALLTHLGGDMALVIPGIARSWRRILTFSKQILA